MKFQNYKMNIPIYVVNYKNPERRQRMSHRFSSLGLYCIFTPEVHKTDPRLKSHRINDLRTASIMLQHLDSIRHFYENTMEDHCIVCEDDIHISKNFVKHLPEILKTFKTLDLDVLMLGYLLYYKITDSHLHRHYFPLLGNTENYNIHGYPDDIWGAQMYLISRKYAKHLLETYTPLYAVLYEDIPYNPDWIITKKGKRGLLNPMIAVEEGVNLSDNWGQNDFHKRCFECNYDSSLFV